MISRFKKHAHRKRKGFFFTCALLLFYFKKSVEKVSKVPESTSAVPLSQEKDYKKNAAHMVDLDYSGSSNSK